MVILEEFQYMIQDLANIVDIVGFIRKGLEEQEYNQDYKLGIQRQDFLINLYQ